MSKSKFQRAIDLVNQHGFILVFPIQNKDEPQSLWSLLYPNIKMKWEWDGEEDGRLAELWRLREKLASSGQVVYGKYYQGRATLFSKNVFRNLLAIHGSAQVVLQNKEAREILDCLEMDSPLSTKQLKEASGLQGKFLEKNYNRALKELWQNFLIVAVGEIDDGAFPSLAHASTKTVFEDLWLQSLEIDPVDAMLELLDLKEYFLLETIFKTEEVEKNAKDQLANKC